MMILEMVLFIVRSIQVESVIENNLLKVKQSARKEETFDHDETFHKKID